MIFIALFLLLQVHQYISKAFYKYIEYDFAHSTELQFARLRNEWTCTAAHFSL